MRLLGPYFSYILVLWGDQEPKNKFKLRILDVFLLNLSQTLKSVTFYQTRRQGKRHLSPLGWKSTVPGWLLPGWLLPAMQQRADRSDAGKSS